MKRLKLTNFDNLSPLFKKRDITTHAFNNVNDLSICYEIRTFAFMNLFTIIIRFF